MTRGGALYTINEYRLAGEFMDSLELALKVGAVDHSYIPDIIQARIVSCEAAITAAMKLGADDMLVEFRRDIVNLRDVHRKIAQTLKDYKESESK